MHNKRKKKFVCVSVLQQFVYVKSLLKQNFVHGKVTSLQCLLRGTCEVLRDASSHMHTNKLKNTHAFSGTH